MKVKVLIIGSIVILALAVLLRFYHLTALPIFADEAIYIRWAQIMRVDPSLRFLPQTDGKQPLYMWVLMPVSKIISDPLLAGRILSGLLGIGTGAGVATVAYLLFKNLRLSLMAAAIWAVLPYSVFFNRMALVDSMLAFFLIWYFTLLYLAISRRRFDMSLLAGFSAGFAWLTKSPAIFALALSPSLLLFLPKFDRKTVLTSIFYLLASYTIAFGMYNILRLGPQFHQIALRNADYVFPLSEVLTHPLDPLVPHLKDSLTFFWYLLTPVGLLFLIWGLLDGPRTHIKQRLILGAWTLTPIFIQSLMARGFTARYLFFTVPFMTILIAHAIEHLGQKTQKNLLTYVACGLLVAVSLWFDTKLVTDPATAPLPRIERSGYLEEWTAGHGLREVSDYIRHQVPNGPIIVGSEGFFGTPFDALSAYLNDLPSVRIVGIGIQIDSVPQKLSQALDDNLVFLVVNSSRFNISNPEKLGLKLIASYPKAARPDLTREHLLFFQVVKP